MKLLPGMLFCEDAADFVDVVQLPRLHLTHEALEFLLFSVNLTPKEL